MTGVIGGSPSILNVNAVPAEPVQAQMTIDDLALIQRMGASI